MQAMAQHAVLRCSTTIPEGPCALCTATDIALPAFLPSPMPLLNFMPKDMLARCRAPRAPPSPPFTA